MQGLSIAGRKRDDGIDFYQTPTWVTEALIHRESFYGSVLEPCSGAGAISEVLKASGLDVFSSDIRRDEAVYGEKGVNIFDIDEYYQNIITNPPYKYATEIIEKSLKIATQKVAMLLKLSFMESLGRYRFFQDTPLKTVYVFCRRVTMYPEGILKPQNSGTIAYAWYVWEHGYEKKPVLSWIND